MTERIKTFRQYVEDKHARAAERHGISRAEAARELPESIYRAEWRAYVVKSFDEGADLPTKLWKSFDEGLRYRVLRSPRALRDDALTARLANIPGVE